MDQLARDYADEAHFLFVYTREAHPENHPEFPAVRSVEQKWEHARALKARHETPRKILVDDVDGAVHRAWGGTSNMSWIVDHSGRVHFKSNWTHEPDLRASLDSAVKMRALKREGGANQYFTEAVWYVRDRFSEGAFDRELERANKTDLGNQSRP